MSGKDHEPGLHKAPAMYTPDDLQGSVDLAFMRRGAEDGQFASAIAVREIPLPSARCGWKGGLVADSASTCRMSPSSDAMLNPEPYATTSP